jgi:restriction endonuclease S subunit
MASTPQPVPNTYVQGNCSGFTPVSEVFTFNIEPICSRAGENVQRQLMFKNRYGHYDYYTFTAGKDEGLDIERQTYKKWSVDWGSANPTKEYYSRGTTDATVSITETHIINTGFLNQPDFMYLEELFTSNEVYEIQRDGNLRPINIVNTEFLRKNKGNRTIVNLELTYVYSNNIALFE